jgi:transketolase
VAPDDPKICLVFADSLNAARATPFTEKYPDRWFDVGICEQNAIAFSAGLASTGLKPFFNTYAGFITMRACEQVRSFVAYPHLNVKLVGLNGGIYGGEREGVTHMVFEEFGILRSIAGMEIVVPADAGQLRKPPTPLPSAKGRPICASAADANQSSSTTPCRSNSARPACCGNTAPMRRFLPSARF